MTTLVIKNKRSQLLFRRRVFARRLVKLVSSLSASLADKSYYSGTIVVTTPFKSVVTTQSIICGTIKVCES